jgi:hypothetical protein
MCVCQGPLKIVVPILPEANQSLIKQKGFTFYWNYVGKHGDTDYSMEVSAQRNFRDLVFEADKTPERHAKVPMENLEPGKYYWRVTTRKNDVKGIWSCPRQFILKQYEQE